MKKIIVLLGIFTFIAISACKKNQLDGNSTIKGKVIHHSKLIPNATVFIKFKATEFPGRDSTVYDAKVKADAEGNYSIKCYKGNYYLYAVGYDDQIFQNVFGGSPVHIRNSETVNIDLAVTED